MTTCQDILNRAPFSSNDITDLGDEVYLVILQMNALFQLKTKSEVLTDFDIPTEDNLETLNAILKLKFVTSRDTTNEEKLQEIQALADDPNVQAQAKSAAVSAAKDVIYTSVVDATKKAVIDEYQPQAKAVASSAAKTAATNKADSYKGKLFSQALVPGYGSTLVEQTEHEMIAAATIAGQNAAKEAVKEFLSLLQSKLEYHKLLKNKQRKLLMRKKTRLKLLLGMLYKQL